MIKLKNISKSFNKKKILDKLSLTLPKKGITIIEGKSGSGKTTLLNIIYKKYSGISYNAIKNYLIKDLSVLENVKYLFYLKGQAFNESLFKQMLKELNIYECKNRTFKDLSAGQKQRVAIMSTLIVSSKVYILDEPFAELDAVNRKAVKGLIAKCAKHSLVIVAFHEAENFKDFSLTKEKNHLNLRISIYSPNEEDKAKNIKKNRIKLISQFLNSTVPIIFNILLSITIGHFLILTIFFNNNIEKEKNSNYYFSDIHHLDMTNEGVLSVYDNIFDHLDGNLTIENFGFSASFYVTAMPIELSTHEYLLQDNEVVLSKTMNQEKPNSNFKVFGINEASDLVGMNINFNNKTYYVKDVIDFGNNLIFLNEDSLKKVELNNFDTITDVKILNKNINLINGRTPQTNEEFVEVITNESYSLNEVVNDDYLVVGHVQEEFVYLTESDYKLIYLSQNHHKKNIYTNSNAVINLLKINSITITNDHDVLQTRIENKIVEQNDTKNLALTALILVLAILLIVSLVWIFIKLYKEIAIRVFLKDNILLTLKDLVLTVFKDGIYLIICSLVIIYLGFLVFNYIYNSAYIITFDLLFILICIIFALKLIAVLLFYFLYLNMQRLKPNYK